MSVTRVTLKRCSHSSLGKWYVVGSSALKPVTEVLLPDPPSLWAIRAVKSRGEFPSLKLPAFLFLLFFPTHDEILPMMMYPPPPLHFSPRGQQNSDYNSHSQLIRGGDDTSFCTVWLFCLCSSLVISLGDNQIDSKLEGHLGGEETLLAAILIASLNQTPF